MMKRKNTYAMFSGVVIMSAVLVILAACNGLVDVPSDEDALAIAEAEKKGLAVVRIPISSISTSRTATTTADKDIGFFDDNQYQEIKKFVKYYEAIFRPIPPATQDYWPVATAKDGESYLTAGLLPNVPYEVLVLAGTPANNNASNGEKVLLGCGYLSTVMAVPGTIKVYPVKMFGLGVKMSVNGMPKGALDVTLPGGESLDSLPIETGYRALRYVHLEKASPAYDSTANPWWNTSYKDLEVLIKLTNLHPLLRASGSAITGGSPGDLAGTSKLFKEESVKIATLSYTKYPMEMIKFTSGTTPTSIGPISGTILQNGTGYSDNPAIEVKYSITAGSGTTAGSDAVTIIPDTDAAGWFYFNYRYNPFSLTNPPSGSSTWNVRNRILWDEEGYYGGGVVFLFGNAAITEVIIDPDWTTP